MRLKLLILFCCAVFATGQDWCNIRWCTPNSHIGCNHDGNFHGSCRNPVAVTFTPAQIQSILHRHNTLRSLTALGHTLGRDGNLPSGVRMAQLRWDSSLAHFANLNTRQCQMRHDTCRNTDAFNFSGQNLAMLFTSGTINIDTFIVNMIDLWFEERQHATAADIPSFNSGRLSEIGHFTALVNERQTHIGCAMSMFDFDSGGTTWRAGLLACNYAFTNVINWPVYRVGAVGSECVLGTDASYPGLCTLNEPINPNP
ncbi:hypothetical protein HA402_001401 [Bradysia odoriphaga]|nr:hypothetical protein HA402_001401 [Bradysia odoriphaga]